MVSIADIPGLINGAHANRGLGCRFLRHIERCPTLAFVIDMAATDGRSPQNDFASLLKELACYDKSLLSRRSFVIANKMDIATANDCLQDFQKNFPNISIFPISCNTGNGVLTLKNALFEMFYGVLTF
jgi:GTP-binding protein